MAEDRFTTLLWMLPTELRDMIYDLALPKFSRHRDLAGDYSGVEWMASSKRLLLEAGPKVYSSACFYHYSSLWSADSSSLVEAVASHTQGLYKPQYSVTAGLIGSMITELVIDLRMDHGASLRRGLQWYFQGTRDMFLNLRRIFVYFGPKFMVKDAGVVSTRENFLGLDVLSRDPAAVPRYKECRDALDLIAQKCPPQCEIRWQSFESLMKKGDRKSK